MIRAGVLLTLYSITLGTVGLIGMMGRMGVMRMIGVTRGGHEEMYRMRVLGMLGWKWLVVLGAVGIYYMMLWGWEVLGLREVSGVWGVKGSNSWKVAEVVGILGTDIM